MIGTLTGSQWGIYDAFKVFVGLYVFLLDPSCTFLSSTVASNFSILYKYDLLDLVGQQQVGLHLLLQLASKDVRRFASHICQKKMRMVVAPRLGHYSNST